MPPAPQQTRCAAVAPLDGASVSRARALAATLSLPYAGLPAELPPPDANGEAVLLFVENERLSVGRNARRAPRFAPRWQLRKSPGSRRDPLLRAIGPGPRSVLDACAGFGEDAFALAQAGHSITACERDPVVFQLLTQAHADALEDPGLAEVAARISLHSHDSHSAIASGELPRTNTIYLDPMFPSKRKRSALPRLELQLLKALALEASEDEGPALLATAQKSAEDRVVWKRPRHTTAEPDVTVSYQGKLIRYDVYYRRPGARNDPG